MAMVPYPVPIAPTSLVKCGAVLYPVSRIHKTVQRRRSRIPHPSDGTPSSLSRWCHFRFRRIKIPAGTDGHAFSARASIDAVWQPAHANGLYFKARRCTMNAWSYGVRDRSDHHFRAGPVYRGTDKQCPVNGTEGKQVSR